jgi:hypothetical protein
MVQYQVATKALPVEEARNVWVPFGSAREQGVHIIEQRFIRWRVPPLAAGSSVATLVNGDQSDALIRKRLGYLSVLPAVLTKPVENTHHAEHWFFWAPLVCEQAKSVCGLKLNVGLVQSIILSR